MLSLIGSVLAIGSVQKNRTSCGVSAGCIGKNDLKDNIVLTVYQSHRRVDDEAKLPKGGSNSFRQSGNSNYLYAIAFANTAANSLSGNTRFVYIKVDVQKLVPKYNGTRSSRALKTPVDLGAVYTVMASTKQGEDKVILNGHLTNLDSSSTNAGFYIALTKKEFENLEFLYFAKLSPVAQISTEVEPRTGDLNVTFESNVISSPGTSSYAIKKNLISGNVADEAKGYEFEKQLLKSLSDMFRSCASSAPNQAINNSMLAKICFANEDIKFINAICDAIGNEWVECCAVDTCSKFEANFNEFCTYTAATTCNVTGTSVCDAKAIEVCRKSASPRATYALCNIVKFYNCTFNNCNVFGAAIFASVRDCFGKVICMPFALEDMCDQYGLEMDTLGDYDCDLVVKAEEKKATTTRSRPARSSGKEAGFFKRHKVAIIVTTSVFVVGGASVCGYFFLL